MVIRRAVVRKSGPRLREVLHSFRPQRKVLVQTGTAVTPRSRPSAYQTLWPHPAATGSWSSVCSPYLRASSRPGCSARRRSRLVPSRRTSLYACPSGRATDTARRGEDLFTALYASKLSKRTWFLSTTGKDLKSPRRPLSYLLFSPLDIITLISEAIYKQAGYYDSQNQNRGSPDRSCPSNRPT